MNNYENNSDMTKDEYEKYCEEKIEEINNFFEDAKYYKYNFEFVNNDDKYILDGKEYYVENSYKQNIEKISETEYRFYYYIFIPDEVLKGKEKFKLSFNNMRIKQDYDKDEVKELEKMGENYIIGKELEEKEINLKGGFEGNFSIEKALENTKILTPKLKEIKYNILSQNIENIKITPMQTIIKVKSILKGIRKDTFRIDENKLDSVDYIGSLNFNIYDEKMEKENGIVFEASRIVKFPDGHVEEWERYQTGPNFEKNQTNPIGADMEIINYIVIPNEEYKEKLNIYPTINKNNDIASYTYNEEIGEYYEIDIK